MHPALAHTQHRPWPLPSLPWAGRQSWLDLAFLHWRVDAARLRRLVPPPLTIQEFDGSSWIGLVPFRMEHVMLRGLPDVPGLSAFLELNVRLYVDLDGRPGVWFLSLDADNALAVWGARRFFHLPYHRARMRCSGASGVIEYESVRQDPPSGAPRFRGTYAPSGGVYRAEPGTLDHFLTERYCLYAATPDGSLRRTEIHHEQWPLQPARADIIDNHMFEPHGIEVEGPPLCHFARRIDMVAWPPARC